MLIRITNPIIDIYNAETNEFFGESKFQLTSQAESGLLGLVNYSRVPSSLILLNLDFDKLSEDYNPPNQYFPKKSKGIIRAIFTESDTEEQTPIEIRFKSDIKSNSNVWGNPIHFDSVELSNIELESIKDFS